MKGKKIPRHYLMIRGTIGKKFVIRHTQWGIIMAKYPDMSKIKASASQRTCRNIFKEAVAWAKQVIADPVRKKEWQKRLRRRNGVYNEAIKFYMLKEKKARLQAADKPANNKIEAAQISLQQPEYAGSQKKQSIPKKPMAVVAVIPGVRTHREVQTIFEKFKPRYA